MTTENFLLDDANTTDQETVRISGKVYPWMQWVYGESKFRKIGGISYLGGFFLPKKNLDVTGNAAWTTESMEYEDKEKKQAATVEGFYAGKLDLCFINERHRYEVSPGDGEGKQYIYSANDFGAAEKMAEDLNRNIVDANKKYKVNKKSQFLVAVKGMEDTPIILTVRNTAARRISGQTGLKQAFDRTVMAFVNEELKKANTSNRLPTRRFWITVGASVDQNGEPDFQVLGKGNNSKSLTVPAWRNMPGKVDMAYVQSIHTGPGNKDRFDTLYKDTLSWSKEWDGIKAGSSKEATDATTEAAKPQTDPETAAALAAM